MSLEKEQIREFLQKMDNRILKVSDDDSLLTTGIIDSLKMVELLSFIEKSYGITVDDDELSPENFETVNSIVSFLEQKKMNEQKLD